MNLSQGKKMLYEQGLNMFAVLRSADLSAAFNAAMQQAQIELCAYPTLILIGHSGNVMWHRLKQRGLEGPDPVDAFSLFHAAEFINIYMDGCSHIVLYPGEISIPLQQLGSLAGWHHSSPLGVGVNERYGPWFGYRLALLVQAKLPVDVKMPGESPCRQCTDKPCVNACPARALSTTDAPDVPVCVDYRMQSDSQCELQCLARLACPVGEQYRYNDEQLHYFYHRSLVSIKAYLAN